MRHAAARFAMFCTLLFASFHSASALAAPVTSGTGPGGIGTIDGSSNLEWWLSADGITGLSDGQAVTTWNDRSGNARNVTGNGQTYETNVVNTLPTVLWASQAPMNLLSSMTIGTIHIVARNAAPTFGNFDGLFNAQDASIVGEAGIYFTGQAGGPNWYGTTQLNNRFVDGRLQGTTIPTLNKFNLFSGTDSTPETFANWVIGRDRGNGGREWDGDVGEVIVHATTSNPAQRIITDNYLSSKYNMPLDTVGGTTQDVYDGDTGPNGEHDFDLIGVGRTLGTEHLDADGGGPGAGVGAAGFGMEVASLVDGEWLVAAHNGDDSTSMIVDGDGLTRWGRTWFIDKTSVDGIDATISFDFSDAGITVPVLGELDAIQLYYAAPGSTEFNPLAVGGTIVGDTYTFALSDALLLDGSYTLGITQLPEPATFAFVMLGSAGLVCGQRRRQQRRG